MVLDVSTILKTPEGLIGALIALGIVLEFVTRPKKKKVYRKKFQ